MTFFAFVYCNGFALAETNKKTYHCWFNGYVSIYGGRDINKAEDGGVQVWSRAGKVFGLHKTKGQAYLENDFFKQTLMPMEAIYLQVIDKENSPGDFVSYLSNPQLILRNVNARLNELTFVYTNDEKGSPFIGETHVAKASCLSP